MEHEFFICACHNADHQVILSFIDDDVGEGYLTIHLKPGKLHKRIWYAIKYILGFKSRFGAFDEFVINAETAVKMTQGLSKIKM